MNLGAGKPVSAEEVTAGVDPSSARLSIAAAIHTRYYHLLGMI